jgi:hypothetical protein
MILIIVKSLELLPGTDHDLETCSAIFLCNLNFKSLNLQTESPFMCATSTHRGSTTLSIFSPCFALCLGHFEFKTLLTLSSAFSKRPKVSVPDHPIGRTCGISTNMFFLGPRIFRILLIFKPPFQRLGSYEFCQSLLSKDSC